MRNPPSDGTVDPKLFWIFLISERAAKASCVLDPAHVATR
jgi:hypothetical protein